jgi:hypothetical protein
VTCPPVPGAGADLDAATADLVAGLGRHPGGRVSPSVYETARLVSLAPWLTGHRERLAYLRAGQRADGTWGGPAGYALVPTLSAVEALLAVLCRADPGVGRGWLRAAVDRALRVVPGLLAGHGDPGRPDLPAADLTVPALVESVNRWLAGPYGAGDRWPVTRLTLPPGADATRLVAVRRSVAAGRGAPRKLLHAWETLGGAAVGAPGVSPEPPGCVGASPAATAAWLGGPGRDGAARAYLEGAAGEHGGPVPCTTPITVFERAWVLSGLVRVGAPVTVAPELVAGLRAAFGPDGVPAAPGLPADADTTAVAAHALALLGSPVDPGCLLDYDLGGHFCTWPGEDGTSVTTNAHVLDALGQHVRAGPAGSPYAPAVRSVTAWLVSRQEPDGGWSDRWHASPYYATACCVLALSRYGHGPEVAAAVGRAVDWTVATQRPDGSWGRWYGTAEESAYAVHVLLATGRPWRPGVAAALSRATAWLGSAAGRATGPALWHDKDLYRPDAIVGAARIAAAHLIRRATSAIVYMGRSVRAEADPARLSATEDTASVRRGRAPAGPPVASTSDRAARPGTV